MRSEPTAQHALRFRAGAEAYREIRAHGFDPASVLELARTLGTPLPRTLLVGCVPLSTEERLGLSPPVEQAVEEAVRLVTRFITGSLSEEHPWSLESF